VSAGAAGARPSDPFDREHCRTDQRLWTATAPGGVVATAHYLATSAGAAMLRAGGNAVDAAVAASAALGVCEPAGSGLGGMTMMLVHLAAEGRSFTIEGPCRAPRAAAPERVAGGRRYRGYRTVAIPANAAVLGHALAGYGTLSAADVLAPAIELAQAGYPVTAFQHRLIARYVGALRRGSAGALLLDQDQRPHPVGHLLRQPALANTLQRLAEAGFEDFYQGAIARTLAADMARNGGFVDAEDLAQCPPPREGEPIEVDFAGARVLTLGPPGGGLALGEMLNLYDALATPGLDPEAPAGCLLLAAIMRRAREDRRRYRLRTGAEHLGDAALLLTPAYAQAAAKTLRAATKGGETTHVSVVDAAGNAVAMTQSIERSFGAAEHCPELGLLYNGFLRAFKVVNRRHPHYLRPGAPARSNACPTMALRDGRPWAVLGSTGSERAASGVFQTLVRLAAGQAPFTAVHGPRLHCSPEGEVLLEAERFSTACKDALQAAGLRLNDLGPYAFKAGGIQLVSHTGDRITGAADPRRDGSAA
jgi:gamma-glutamyltranspeptidase/glutathione hydrolase